MRYFLINILICVLFIGCRDKGLPPLNQTFSYKDKNPFGTYVSKQLLSQSFPQAPIKIAKSLYDIVDDSISIYFSVSHDFYLDKAELEEFKYYVNRGNTAFISAYNIDPGVLLIYDSSLNYNKGMLNLGNDYTNTSISIVKSDKSLLEFNYFFHPFSNAFIKVSENKIIKGLNTFKQPNFIEIKWGKGTIFLHNDPRAFSNYFLLSKDNYKYFEAVLNLFKINPVHIYWAAESKFNSKGKSDSAWTRLMNEPALANAVWIVLILLIAYIIFESRRKQRIIPVKEINKNKSIEFAEVLSNLYLSKKDNKNIALKMISYFNEYCRNRFFINDNISNLDPKILSGKSGVDLNEVKLLIEAIISVENLQEVPDELLISLQTQIHKFYK